MELHRSVLVRATPDDVSALIRDVTASPRFFRGVTRWAPVSDQLRGVGARFRVLIEVGSIEGRRDREGHGLGRRRPGHRLELRAWHHPVGRWTVEPVGDGTRLHLHVGFSLAGPMGWFVERVTGRIVGRNLQATLLTARRLIEHHREGGA